MIIRPAAPDDTDQLLELIAQCRVTLGGFRGTADLLDLGAAGVMLEAYRRPGYQLFVADDAEERQLAGYVACQVIPGAVRAESLYVAPDYRRQGVGSRLYEQVERLNEEVGGETIYNWIQPNNDRIIRFLQRRGYTVLNLVEIRGPLAGERFSERIRVGSHVYDY
jgi:ribosomal protein S18 acetylase RimI-like enzyme